MTDSRTHVVSHGSGCWGCLGVVAFFALIGWVFLDIDDPREVLRFGFTGSVATVAFVGVALSPLLGGVVLLLFGRGLIGRWKSRRALRRTWERGDY